MKGSERAIISGAAVLICAIAFYLLVLSPKRAEVAELNDQVTSLEASVAEQEQVIAFGKQARKEFPRDYGRLVVLGKAVPDEADTASLLVELDSIATASKVDFRGIALNESGSGGGETIAPAAPTPAPAAPAAPAATGDSAAAAPAPTAEGATSTETTAAPAAATTPAPATEASAASLPMGAVVGTAGLPTLPYNLTINGGFFNLADYMGRLDDLVQFQDKSGQVQVGGRLFTIDGFAMSGGRPGSDPKLDAGFMLTSYVTPSTQGLTAGATLGGPAVEGVPAATTSPAVAP